MFNMMINIMAAIVNLVVVVVAIRRGNFGLLNYLNFFFVFFSSYIAFLCYVGYKMGINIVYAHELVYDKVKTKYMAWYNTK